MHNIPRLSAKIQARNAVNRAAREAWASIYTAIAPFVGKKILKADGSFTQAFRNALPEGLGDYWNRPTYSISRVSRKSQNVEGQSGCEYQDATLYFAEVSDGVLTRMMDSRLEGFRTDYKLEDVVAALEHVRKLETELSAAKSACHPFGD